jgi:hypothetical protein
MKKLTRTKAKLSNGRTIYLKAVSFEKALPALRSGQRLRRRAWHPESYIFALGDKVFLKLPDGVRPFEQKQEYPAEYNDNRPGMYGSAPTFWRPYPQDILARDWWVVE